MTELVMILIEVHAACYGTRDPQDMADGLHLPGALARSVIWIHPSAHILIDSTSS